MLLFKESAYIENRKYYEGVDDTLVREYHDILNSLEEEDLGNFAPSEVVSYLYRKMDSIPSSERINFLSSFFNNSLKNDIKTIKVWVSYLDTHMEERYVEDGETMIEYRSSIEGVPLAIRGEERYEVIVFIENILKGLELDSDEIIRVLNDIDYNNLELPDEEFENYEPTEEEYEDRAYYEQRPRKYTV
jgi:hypothetical protein